MFFKTIFKFEVWFKILIINTKDGGDGNEKKPLQEGELSNVDPRAVHVRQKAEQGNQVVCSFFGESFSVFLWFYTHLGMEFHKDANGRYLPILPQFDPNKPIKKPKFSVSNIPKEDLFKKRKVKSQSKRKTSIRN